MSTNSNAAVHFPTTDIHCQDLALRRRHARASKDVNGIDCVEVKIRPNKRYVVFSLLKPALIEKSNINIDGLDIPNNGPLISDKTNRHYQLQVVIQDQRDIYTLKIHSSKSVDAPLTGFDPLLSEAEFSFDVDAESDRDLPAAPACPPPALAEPEMNYLAKDYASFRQLALDRLALIMPEWRERHVPDLSITLVELLAYVGDYLSYYQDAVATEAYLDTARQRISVRRHARLVDYRMHEGCNARVLVCLAIDPDELEIDLDNIYFITDYGLTFPLPGVVNRESELKDAVGRERYEIFEPIEPGKQKLYYAHNRIDFYTWGERECCLPKGATRAALRDGPRLLPFKPQPETAQPEPSEQQGEPAQHSVEQDKSAVSPVGQEEALCARLDKIRVLHLQKGDMLIFEELFDPRTGLEEDADPAHRHAVRLTKVTRAYDLPNRQAVLEIEWDGADALPFPLCLTATTDDCEYLEGISVARGNVVLADHGETVDEDLDPVDPSVPELTCDECGEAFFPRPRGYRPRLKHYPIVFRETPNLDGPIYSLLYPRDPRAALPVVTLEGYDPYTQQTDPWQARYDLLSSGGDDRDFTVEVDDERIAHLRFGDDDLGEQPAPNMRFHARYRFGEPLAGNVGPEAISRLIVRTGIIEGIVGVRNPLAAAGGEAPETVANVKLRAPHAFRQQMLRAITADDYARLAEQHVPALQRVFAKLTAQKANGQVTERSTVDVYFDPLSTTEMTTEQITKQIEDCLYPFRRIGHDVVPASGTPVLLTVTITVKIKEQAIKERVTEALKLALGSQGFFHPDKLTFETGISLSQIVATAQRAAGVAYVKAVVVESQDSRYREEWPDASGTGDDLMTFNPGEIPSLGTLNVTCE